MFGGRTVWTVADLSEWRRQHFKATGQWWLWRDPGGTGRKCRFICHYHGAAKPAVAVNDVHRQRETNSRGCGCTARVDFTVVGPHRVSAKWLDDPATGFHHDLPGGVGAVELHVTNIVGEHVNHPTPLLVRPWKTAQLPPAVRTTVTQFANAGASRGQMIAFITQNTDYRYVSEELLSNIKNSVTKGGGANDMPNTLAHLRALKAGSEPTLVWKVYPPGAVSRITRLFVTTTIALAACVAWACMAQFDAYFTVGKMWATGWGLTMQVWVTYFFHFLSHAILLHQTHTRTRTRNSHSTFLSSSLYAHRTESVRRFHVDRSSVDARR
jgi:hypothetical protein